MMEVDAAGLAADGGVAHKNMSDDTFSSEASVALAAASDTALSTSNHVASLSASSSPSPPPLPPHELARQLDLRRPIRTLLPPTHQVTIPVRLLNAELTCGVCLGIIRGATAVSECLHRFCASCINASLRHHKKECPQCRVACPSHRNLRKDEHFDRIIGSIYPDLEQTEYEQERQAEALIDSAGLSKFAESAVRGAQRQAADAKQRLVETRRLQEEAKLEEKARRQREENSVYLRLQLLPSSSFDAELGNISVRTRKQISVDLLRLWIEHKLKEAWREARKNEAATAANGTTAATAAASAPRVRVSFWCRWSEMSDVSRQIWTKAREQPPASPPPPPPAPPAAAATAATDAAAASASGAVSGGLVIRLPKFPPTSAPTPCTYDGDKEPTAATTAPTTTAAAPAVSDAGTSASMQDDDASTAGTRKRKRLDGRSADDVAGFVPHSLTRSEYCQLGNRTPLRSLPSAVLDDSRLMGGRSGGGSGARRITLLYQADEVDADGQLVKKLATEAAAARPELNGTAAAHSAPKSVETPSSAQSVSSSSSPPSPEPQFTPAVPAVPMHEEDDSWM